MPKYDLFLDIETSHLKPEHGVILSIGAVVEKHTKTDPVREFYAEYAPTIDEWHAASPHALAVNGLTWERLQTNGLPWGAFRDNFLLWLHSNRLDEGRTRVIGQNPTFDISFLHYYMGDELAFIGFYGRDLVDVRALYSILATRKAAPFLSYRSGQAISAALGIEPEPDPHNALEGARAAQRNYHTIMQRIAETERPVEFAHNAPATDDEPLAD